MSDKQRPVWGGHMSRRSEPKRESTDLEHLTAEYTRLALLYGQALEDGDHKKANAHHARITKLYQMLSSLGPAAQQELLHLLEHPEVAVRCWAASHTLNFAPERGAPVLSRIAEEGPTPLCLTAEAVLSAWRSGTL